ncbi:MAG: ATP-binding region ATPase domain protein [Gemmatimonadetes bacterium]|nr:ATP-binding region ATPase domain protein [Gemmatimonadota bacterium]
MASTRARLTVSYAVVLLGTMVAFGMSIWAGLRSEATNALAREAFRVAEQVLVTMQAAQSDNRRLTYIDSTNVRERVTRPTKAMADVLDLLPGFFVVLDQQGKLLYPSTLMRQLSGDDQTKLLQNWLQLKEEANGVRVPIRGDSLVLLAVAKRNVVPGANISRVVAALPANAVEVPGGILIGTMIMLAPIIFLVSMVVAYLVVGNAFKPVDQLINEVEAITDGRSLHRRLPADASNDELSRLGLTVNAMLSRLETSFAALRRFTADASHELKTPLTVLRVDVERAMHPGTVRADRMVALEEALQETARMADLVDSLLTLARADEGRFDIHRTPVEVEPLMREVYETAVILGEDAGLSLSMPKLENAVVMGDRTRLRQLLLNLVTNAIKYTPRGGKVDVSVTRRPNDEIAIVVRDTGMGIAANDLPHVFDRFWRADRVRSRGAERGGFGLGLSISQWIVQAHGGSLVAQSRLGRGSVFTVMLPVVPESVAPDEAVADAAEAIE